MPLLGFSAADNDTTKAINNAIANIKSKGDNVMPMMVPTLDHLINAYHIPLNIDKQKRNMVANAKGSDRVFLRFLNDTIKAPLAQVQLMPGIDRVTAAALYCDCYGLPETFFSDVNDMAYNEGYGLTHSVLALSIIKDRKCKYDTVAYNTALNTLVPMLQSCVENVHPDTDMGIEAIVMLYITGNGAKVKAGWINAILKAQLPDGSWNRKDHTTVLALWALLEAQKSAVKQ